MDYRKLKNHRPTLVVAATLCLVLLVGIVAQQSAMAARHTRLNDLLRNADSLQAKLPDLSALEQEVTGLREQYSRIVGQHTDMAMGQLLQRLGQDMIDVGAVDRQVQTGSAGRLLQWTRLPLNIRFNGDYRSTQSFLNRLEAYPIIIHADRISITRSDRGEADGKPPLQIQIDLTALTPSDAGEVR